MAHRSTEIALVKKVNNEILASDQGCVSLLVLLDLKAAIDTVINIIHLDKLFC